MLQLTFLGNDGHFGRHLGFQKSSIGFILCGLCAATKNVVPVQAEGDKC